MGFFSDFADDVLGIDPNGGGIYNIFDDVLGIDPNGGGIYNIFDDVLGIDPNGGGIFPLLEAVGIESNAQDVYGYVDDLLGRGITSIIQYYLGVPIEIDVKLLASPKDPKVAINFETGVFKIFEYGIPSVLAPNEGGIYSIFDDVLGIDPNGGGIFSLLEAVGIESNAQDVYGYVDDLLGKGITSITRDYLGVPIEIDVKLLASSNNPKVAINLDTSEFQVFESSIPPVFDPSQYLASNGDLINAFGYDLQAATTHYKNYGIQEGRAIDLFNEAQYLASHGDLINAFGYDLEEATRHYIVYGFKEGRSTDLFDPVQYLENYGDLQTAFGNDLGLATKHYIEYGFSEGRSWL